jgi:uncharacterized membrane protein
MNKEVRRLLIVDFWRTLAVLMMIVFHIGYDMNVFKMIRIDLSSPFWYYFPRVIVFFFLYAVGLSQYLSYHQGMNWPKFWSRFTKIFGGAIVITVTTYFMFPQNWVYFGTLHCIAIGSLVAVFFLRFQKVSLLMIILIIGTYQIAGLSTNDLSILKDIKSMDFIPLYPWVWVILFGQLSAKYFIQIPLPHWKWINKLNFLGRHSLIIYLLHQPIIYGILWLINQR